MRRLNELLSLRLLKSAQVDIQASRKLKPPLLFGPMPTVALTGARLI